MFQDTRIIHAHGQHQVRAQRCEVMFRDGSAVGLHPVITEHGDLQMFLRAVHYEGLRWIVFDLRDLSPEIEHDILRLQPRDSQGVVFFTLRGLFPTARAFGERVTQCFRAAWWQHDAAVPA